MSWKPISSLVRWVSPAHLRQACPFSKIGQKFFDHEIPQLTDVNEAVREYQVKKDFFHQEWYLKQMERADYQGAPAPLRLWLWRYMRALRARGLPFYVHTCYRTPAEQLKQYNEGDSKVKSGAHQRSAAMCIVSSVDHWNIPDPLWNYVGTLGEQVARDTFLGNGVDGKPLSIQWGGRWSFYDPAHWQLSDWKKRAPIMPKEPLRLSPYSDRMRFG